MAGEVIFKSLLLSGLYFERPVQDSGLGALSCSAWTCNTGDVPALENSCDGYVSSDDTHYLTPCADATEYCVPSVDESKNSFGFCADVATPTEIIVYPGEYCDDYIYICSTGSCSDNVCAGHAGGSKCLLSYECEIGHYCDNETCKEKLEIGDECTINEECPNNSKCFTDLEKEKDICTLLFSVEPGKEIDSSDCIATSVVRIAKNWFCTSGYCGLNSDSKAFCTDSITVSEEITGDCSNDVTICESDIDVYAGVHFYSSCVCGKNPAGTAYCNLFLGEEQSKPFYKKIVKYYQEQAISCNRPEQVDWETEDIKQCLASLESAKDVLEYDYYRENYMNYPLYQDNDRCVKNTVNRYYWYLDAYINSTDDDDDDDDNNDEEDDDRASGIIMTLAALGYLLF